MKSKGPMTAEQVAALNEKQEQFFDRWMNRVNLGSAFAAAAAVAVAGGCAVAGAAAGAAVVAAAPIALGIGAGFGIFWAGAKVVDHIHHDKKGPIL